MSARRLLGSFTAPSLPIAEKEYATRYFDKFNAILRLYFNRLDNAITTLLNINGGALLNNPYGAFYTNSIQTLSAANTITTVTLSSTQGANGMTLASNRITFDFDGIYHIEYNLQCANSNAGIQDVTAWIRKNGTDVPNSAFLFTITEKHGAVDGRVDSVGNFGVQIAATDYVEIMWAATNTNVTLYYEAAQTVPYAHPSVPSVYATVTFISAV
jgi:hypothetical protein